MSWLILIALCHCYRKAHLLRQHHRWCRRRRRSCSSAKDASFHLRFSSLRFFDPSNSFSLQVSWGVKFRFWLLINILSCFFLLWWRWCTCYAMILARGSLWRYTLGVTFFCNTLHLVPFFPTPLVSGGLFCSNFTIFIFMNETHSPAPAHTDHTPSSQGDYSLFLYFYICYSRFLSPFQYSAAQSSPRCIIIFLCFSMLLLLRCFYCTLLHSLSVDLAGIAAL